MKQLNLKNQQASTSKKLLPFITFFLTILLAISFLLAQEKIDGEKLQEEITQVEKDLEEEEKYFKEFEKQQRAFIQEKKLELAAVREEIKQRTKELAEVNQEIFTLETQIAEIDSFNSTIKTYLLAFTKELKQSILTGIPFEKEKRVATINTLINDLENNLTSAVEALTRISNFLDAEEALGYDSQNIKVIEKINGVAKEVELIRIGRVFFALIDGDNIFLFEKNNNNEYQITTDKKPSFNQIRTLQNISDMLQGRKAPEISEILLNLKLLKKN